MDNSNEEPKKKHKHKHHSKDREKVRENVDGEGKKKHHRHHRALEDIPELETEERKRNQAFTLNETEEKESETQIGDIADDNILNKKDEDLSLKPSDLIKSKKRHKKNAIVPIVGLAPSHGSAGRITKLKDKKHGFGLQSNAQRLSLKKPNKDLEISTSSIQKAPSLDSVKAEGDNDIVVSLQLPNQTGSATSFTLGSKSYGSQGSRGGNATPEDDYYDTEELRILNHEKMVKLTNKKVNPFVAKWKQWIAGMDTFAAKHPTVFHNMCIKISVVMLPILLIALIWDSCAGFLLEIPHWSTINHPGFMMVFHFISLPTAMYGYMMRSLMGRTHSNLSRLGILAMFIHPLLLAYRCYLEWHFNDYRGQEKVRYEYYQHHTNFDNPQPPWYMIYY